MHSTRVTSPPTKSFHDRHGNHHQPRFSNQSIEGHFAGSSTPMAMAIPNRRRPEEEPPPPLPPPRFIEALAAGSDPANVYDNDSRDGNFGLSSKSSLAGSKGPRGWEVSRMAENRPPERPEYKRQESFNSTARSPIDSERRYDFSRHQDEGYYSLSGPHPFSQQLQGERQLHHRDQEKSSQAYDNKLLSKIGKPKTPPGPSTFGSVESSPTSKHYSYSQGGIHPNPPRALSFPNTSTSAYSDSPIKREPAGRFGDSPRSRPISPSTSLVSSVASGMSFSSYRSPTRDRGTPSTSIDSESYSSNPRYFPSSSSISRQQKSRRSGSGSILPKSGYDDSSGGPRFNTTSAMSRPIKQENYDRSIFSEPDSTFRMDEPLRQLHLEDRPPLSSHPNSASYYLTNPNPSLHSHHSRSGMKRKQLSPAPEASHEGPDLPAQLLQHTASTAEELQRTQPQHLSAGQFAHHPASISSQSSGGFRNGSYASSGGFSGTSIISYDQQGEVSPTSEQQQQQQQQQQYYQHNNPQESSHLTSSPMNPDSRNARAGQYTQLPITKPQAIPPRKTNEPPAQRRSNAPNLQSHVFICSCCPKKPKKFDTQGELQAHQAEKQYVCRYCHNRFKNKNEMERHQNSLHLRNHSWSCSNLGGNFDLAFYPSTSIPPADNTPVQPPPPPNTLPPSDICGYCGEQFPNDPPDWPERARHLNVTHKFGECNQSKKFFRADHFRQHLKHSHAGTSGKWTNMLETQCMKDEPPATPRDDNMKPTSAPGAPVANMSSMGQPPIGPNDMSQGVIAQEDINLENIHAGVNNQGHMGLANQASAGQAHMGQMDMSNIDPNIGLQPMSGMAPVSNMGSRPQQQMQIRSGGYHNDLKEEDL